MSRALMAGHIAGCPQMGDQQKKRKLYTMYGQFVTVFGGYGLLGTGVCQAFSQSGIMILLPFRPKTWMYDHRRTNNHVRDWYNLYVRAFDPTKPAQIRAMIEPVDAVAYMCSRQMRPSIWRFRELDWGHDAVHRCLPVEIAKFCAEMEKETLIYTSMIGVDINSASCIMRAKAKAEIELREIFPDTIIVRPADIMSTEIYSNGGGRVCTFRKVPERLKNNSWMTYPEMLSRRMRPVLSTDIGVAMVYMMRDRAFYGKTFELGGRQELSFEEWLRYMSRLTKLPIDTFRAPYPMVIAFMSAVEHLHVAWGGGLNAEWYRMMQYDAVPAENDPNILGWADLGIDERELVLMDEAMPHLMHGQMIVHGNYLQTYGASAGGGDAAGAGHANCRYTW